MNDSLLMTSLLDLWAALGIHQKDVLLGGGYGLYLKQLYMQQEGQPTLIDADGWPAPRATHDLDLMLTPELVGDASAMTAVRAALDELQYQEVAGSEYLQFKRRYSTTQSVKVDLLTVQLDVLRNNSSIRADKRRAGPAIGHRPAIHAHPTDGALVLNDSPLIINVSGRKSSGEHADARVRIPAAWVYLLMKLTAYRDRRHDPDKDMGRHHAFDIFRIVAMLTEDEYREVRERLKHHSDNPQVRSCADIASSDFCDSSSRGLLAIRDHPFPQNEGHISQFLEAIAYLLHLPLSSDE